MSRPFRKVHKMGESRKIRGDAVLRHPAERGRYHEFYEFNSFYEFYGFWYDTGLP